MLGKIHSNLGLDCFPKLSWEFFLGYNPIKPLRDLLFGYVPEGYDQAEEEEAFRNRQRDIREKENLFTHGDAQKFFDTDETEYHGA